MMKGKILSACALIGVLVMMTATCRAFAQEGPVAVTVTFTQQELDQMLAPIALYPDSLLAQILIAATYPDQVMDADRWLRAHPELRGPALNAALDRMDWDLSIKALAPFPQVLDMMAQEPEWTRRLGEAFLAQQADVMNSVQRLRRRAEAAGNLRTTEQQRVIVRTDYIEIMPVNPEVIYIPRYNPLVVYGTWWWPAYPPFAYYPVWPGVVVAPVVGVFGFWGAITVGPAWSWGWGSWGWGSHNVYLNVNRNININTTNVTLVRGMRRDLRTTSLRRAVTTGRFGGRSATWTAARARLTRTGRTGLSRRGFGRTAVGTRSGRTGLNRRGFGSTAVGTRSGRTGANGSRFGRTAVGSRSGRTGFRGRSLGGRPSAATVMQELRGGRVGARGGRVGARGSRAGATGFRSRNAGGRTGSLGSRRTQGSFGQRTFERRGTGRRVGSGGRATLNERRGGRSYTGVRNRGGSRATGTGIRGSRFNGGTRNFGRAGGGQFRNAGARREIRAGARRGGGGGGRRNGKRRR